MEWKTKLLTDKQLTQIVMQIVFDKQGIIDDYDTYRRFVEDLGQLVTAYCGGEVASTERTRTRAIAVRIARTDAVPDDGGVYSNFDTGVSWVRNDETTEVVI